MLAGVIVRDLVKIVKHQISVAHFILYLLRKVQKAREVCNRLFELLLDLFLLILCSAKVISELRDTSSISPSSPSLSRTSELLPAELIDFCVDYFFSNVYPMQPILPRQSVQHSIAGMHQPDAYCLIVALCAYMMVQPHMQLPPGLQPDAQTGSVQNLGTKLLADVMETRKHYNYVEECTVSTITTSFFLFGSHICHDRHKVAWYYLREATTLALSLDMHKEDTYSRTGLPDSIFMRRLYWLLFVTERFVTWFRMFCSGG